MLFTILFLLRKRQWSPNWSDEAPGQQMRQMYVFGSILCTLFRYPLCLGNCLVAPKPYVWSSGVSRTGDDIGPHFFNHVEEYPQAQHGPIIFRRFHSFQQSVENEKSVKIPQALKRNRSKRYFHEVTAFIWSYVLLFEKSHRFAIYPSPTF